MLAAVAMLTAPAGHAADDISDYEGTTCPANQFYDATTGTCASDDGQGVAAQQQGTSDPGTACKESQFYDVGQQKCLPDVVTNDPEATVTPEGEDPADYTVPSASGIPDCANGGSDPFWICT